MKIKYNSKDFSEKTYKILLKKINNKTIFYDEIRANDKFTLWRHDVDISVHRAYQLAKIEKKKNIRATYFLLLGSNFYNIFEKEIKTLINKISSLGHQLGLHFDLSNYDIKTKKQLEKYLTFEKQILENLFQTKIKVFSFHNYSKKCQKFNNFTYANMINVYSRYFKSTAQYLSDSNGYWRFRRLDNFLDQKYEKVHVLTHPVWWQKKTMLPFDKIKKSANGRLKNMIFNYQKVLKKTGRKNINKI